MVSKVTGSQFSLRIELKQKTTEQSRWAGWVNGGKDLCFESEVKTVGVINGR